MSRSPIAEIVACLRVAAPWHGVCGCPVIMKRKRMLTPFVVLVGVTTVFDGCFVAHSDGALMRAA